jgi:hypothetical protein
MRVKLRNRLRLLMRKLEREDILQEVGDDVRYGLEMMIYAAT